jgi:photosystem II stability/assembly factor-like uncharacterized protein
MTRHSSATWLLFASVLISSPAFGQRATPPAKAPVASQAAASGASSYKGILEPVNYSADVNLTDVFFTSVDEGWVAGEHGTILHTSNGGANWTAQVGGDPQSADPKVDKLRFLDNHHGWAVFHSGYIGRLNLLRTTDGQNWEQVGSIPGDSVTTLADYQFSTPRNGIAVTSDDNGATIWHTRDGGHTWKEAVPWASCHAKVNLSGLWRDANCSFGSLQFVSPTVAYAVGHVGYSTNTLFIGKTLDGGNTWRLWALEDTSMNGAPRSITFINENHGLTFIDNRIYATTDGAQTWRPLLATTGGTVHFADPEVGWGVDHSGGTLNYTVNGGNSWSSKSINLPAPVTAFSFPRRDRAYLAGVHGLIYRYRSVPANYSVANAVDVPLMPAFGGLELASKADAIRRDIQQLMAKLPAPPAQAGSGAGSFTQSAAPASSAGPRSGGFTQQTDATAAATAAPSDSSSGFSQDTTPISPALANCCGAAIQNLQNDTASFAQQGPVVASQYQPLNLITAGAQWAVNLTNQAHTLWNSFLAFKHAANPQGASAALQTFSAGVNTAQQTASTGLQNPGAWFASNAPADFVRDAGPTSSVTFSPAVTGVGDQATVAAAGAPDQIRTQRSATTPSYGQNQVNQAISAATQKIRNKLKLPF